MNEATEDSYVLLDFGAGRKLEQFGEVVLDRPCPAAEGVAKRHLDLWSNSAARYDRTHGEQGAWTPSNVLPKQWMVSFSIAADDEKPECPLTFQLQLSPFGHVGVFPEQRENWRWIVRQVRRGRQRLGRPPRVLNLFAYTGGGTLAAAAAGAEVVHIDAARNMVDRARENAAISGLANHPIRWIVEDALKYCRREVKRGNHYDAVILDPPSYGHGPKGEAWKIGDHLLPLLNLCGELTADNLAFVLATCHTPGIGPPELAAYMADGIMGHCSQSPLADELVLDTRDGRRLRSGVYARWPK